MFIIGKANKNEIEEIKKLGFDVEKVDTKHFDLAMGGEGIEKEDNGYGDKLIAIYLDCDIVQECRSINALEKLVNVVTGN